VTCSAPIGNVDCLGTNENGANNGAITTTQNATSPAATGDNLKITLDVESSIGDVEVIRQ
jgi:hypothetical protein